MEVFYLVIDIMTGLFILTALFGAFAVIMGWIEDKLEIKHEDRTHHDNRPGSYYYESQRALRDKRRY